MMLIMEYPSHIVRHTLPDGSNVVVTQDCIFTPEFVITDMGKKNTRIVETPVDVPPDIKKFRYMFDPKAQVFTRMV